MNIFSILPGRFESLRQNVMRAAEYDAQQALRSGPASDLERSGYPVQVRSGMGIVRVRGEMVKAASPSAQRFFGLASASDLRMAVRAAAQDEDVRTIVMLVDSPGGSVDGLAELGDEVRAAAQIKPVIAQVDGMAASAAYYAIANATEIRAQRMDMVGSIGTYLAIPDMSGMAEQMGIEMVVAATGELKGMGIPGTELTEAHRAEMQRLVNRYFADFRSAVISGRTMTAEQFERVSTGAVFVGDEAVSLGLVDKISSVDETLRQFAVQPTSRRRTMQATAMQQAIRLRK